jgi:hypothetical protein
MKQTTVCGLDVGAGSARFPLGWLYNRFDEVLENDENQAMCICEG